MSSSSASPATATLEIRRSLAAAVERYARKSKPAKNQSGLFDGPEKPEKPDPKKKDEEGRWVTMNGAHVFIENDDDEPFQLQAPKKKSAKPVFGDNENRKQNSLFDVGKKKELKGQELLFNSDAGDLHNPRTMENRVKETADRPDSDQSEKSKFSEDNGKWSVDGTEIDADEMAKTARKSKESIWATAKREFKVGSMMDIPQELRRKLIAAMEQNTAEEEAKKAEPLSPGRERAMRSQMAQLEKMAKEDREQFRESVRNAVSRYSGNAGRRPVRSDRYFTLSPTAKKVATVGGLALLDATLRPHSSNTGVRLLNRLIKSAMMAYLASLSAQAQPADAAAANPAPATQPANPAPAASTPDAGTDGSQNWESTLSDEDRALLDLHQKNTQKSKGEWENEKTSFAEVGPKSEPKSDGSSSGNGGGNEKDGDWITIGGSPGPEGKHQGGTPVKVDDSGEIVAGPDSLEGKPVDDLSGDSGSDSGSDLGTGDSETAPDPPSTPDVSSDASSASSPATAAEPTSSSPQLAKQTPLQIRQQKAAERREQKRIEKATSFDPEQLESESQSALDDSTKTRGGLSRKISASHLPNVAADYEMTADELKSVLSPALDRDFAIWARRESAKRDLKQIAGRNARQIDQWEDAGKDVSHMKDLDIFLGQWAEQYPEFAGHDESEWANRAWELMKERKSPASPGWHNEDWLRQTAEEHHSRGDFASPGYHPESASKSTTDDLSPEEALIDSLGNPVPFSRSRLRSHISRTSGDFRTSGVSRSAIVAAVQRYMRRIC